MRHAWMVLGIAAALAQQAGARAAGPPGESDPPALCLHDLVPQEVSVTPTVINFGEPVTLRWRVSVPGPCPGLQWNVVGQGIFEPSWTFGSAGSRLLFPGSAEPFVVEARVAGRPTVRTLGTASVTVNYPPLPVVDGRPNVEITSGDQVARFVQAIATPNAIVRIAEGVELDLTNRAGLTVASGVQIIGRRSSRSRGPRLFTRTFPDQLFQIGRFFPADKVRITGLRIEGAEMGIAEEAQPGSTAIVVYDGREIEIDNNEIYGWRGSAVQVLQGGRTRALRGDMLVHDNFIHHNQRYGSLGYGVVVSEGAYAAIENNVFDYNRHAIAAAGAPGTAYEAEANLVLEHGGMNWGPLNFNTHQFDVHGTTSCWWAEAYCGDAGWFFNFRYNTIMYDHGTAIKLRGKPSLRAVADGNVFKHPDEWGGYVDDAALVQNHPGDNPLTRNLISQSNTFGADWDDMEASSRCDFNGDGTPDRFVATGATWWYYSQPAGSWLQLRRTHQTLSQVTVGHFNQDGYCDVKEEDTGIVRYTEPGQELHGRRLQDPARGGVFLILDQRARLLSPAVHARLFRSTAGITAFDVSAILRGGDVYSNAVLARSVEDPAVYLITNGRKHWITSAAAMDNFGFDWSKIVYLPRQEIDAIARGGDLTVDSTGTSPAVVPDVRGLGVSAAWAAVQAAGFARGTATYRDDPTCNNIGIVTSQTPPAGRVLPAGTVVNLTAGKQPRTPCL
jgi:hypothetical protein